MMRVLPEKLIFLDCQFLYMRGELSEEFPKARGGGRLQGVHGWELDGERRARVSARKSSIGFDLPSRGKCFLERVKKLAFGSLSTLYIIENKNCKNC
jgi:hypothetical protein